MGCCGPSNPKESQEAEKHLSPVDLLKIRLAKGEITFEEYEKTKAILVN
jgi:uncharacterized membrane protein